jgi:hypothetical protein
LPQRLERLRAAMAQMGVDGGTGLGVGAGGLGDFAQSRASQRGLNRGIDACCRLGQRIQRRLFADRVGRGPILSARGARSV